MRGWVIGLVPPRDASHEVETRPAAVVLLPFAISEFGVWNAGSIALLVCVTYWGVRLTANWAYTFHGYAHQDWRYTMLREKSGALFPPSSRRPRPRVASDCSPAATAWATSTT